METLKQKYERRVQREKRRIDALCQLKDDQIHHNLLEYRDDFLQKNASKRFQQLEARMEEERIRQDALIQKAYNQEKRQRDIENTDRLARQLQDRKDEEYRDEQLRLRVRLNSTAIRDLESQLRRGYQRKELDAQMAEKRALKFDELARESEINKIISEEQKKVDERLKLEQHRKLQDKLSRIKEYNDVIVKKEELDKKNANEEYYADRLRIDEIIREVNEKNQQERIKEHEKKMQTREWLRNGVDAKNLRLEENKKKDKLIEDAAKAHQRVEDIRKITGEEERKLRQERSAKLAEQLYYENQKREEENNRRATLRQLMEEFKEEEKARTSLALEREKHIKQREEAKLCCMEQLQLRRKQREFEKAEETALQLDTLAHYEAKEKQFAENEKLKKILNLKYGEDLRHQLADRQAAYYQECIDNDKLEEEIQRREKEKLSIEDEERMRLLREHAPNLVGYLPKGVFRSFEEIKELGGYVEAEYQPYKPTDDFPVNPDIEDYKTKRNKMIERTVKEAKDTRKQQSEEYRKSTVFNPTKS